MGLRFSLRRWRPRSSTRHRGLAPAHWTTRNLRGSAPVPAAAAGGSGPEGFRAQGPTHVAAMLDELLEKPGATSYEQPSTFRWPPEPRDPRRRAHPVGLRRRRRPGAASSLLAEGRVRARPASRRRGVDRGLRGARAGSDRSRARRQRYHRDRARLPAIEDERQRQPGGGALQAASVACNGKDH